jgi:hypothetical protein
MAVIAISPILFPSFLLTRSETIPPAKKEIPTSPRRVRVLVGHPRRRFKRKKLARKAVKVHRILRAYLILSPP